jgi:hypothetical protein
MTIKSTRPVSRESCAVVRDKRLRPVIVTVVRDVIELRAKGFRSREILDVASCYYLAVRQRVASERAERRRRERGTTK